MVVRMCCLDVFALLLFVLVHTNKTIHTNHMIHTNHATPYQAIHKDQHNHTHIKGMSLPSSPTHLRAT